MFSELTVDPSCISISGSKLGKPEDIEVKMALRNASSDSNISFNEMWCNFSYEDCEDRYPEYVLDDLVSEYAAKRANNYNEAINEAFGKSMTQARILTLFNELVKSSTKCSAAPDSEKLQNCISEWVSHNIEVGVFYSALDRVAKIPEENLCQIPSTFEA